MNSIQRIAKNISVSGISQIIISILGFLFLIYVARYLGESEFGIYSFAISFTSLFILFADIGISQLIVREIARNKDLTSEYMSNSLILKFILSIITFVLIALTVNFMGYPQEVIQIVYLFGIYTILSSFAQMFMSVFQAFEKMEYNAIMLIVEKIILLPLGFLVLFLGYGLLELAYVYIIAGVLKVIIGVIITSLKISKPATKIDFKFSKALATDSLPFGLNVMFATLFFQIDTVLLSILKDDAAVGIYNAAYNPLLSLSSIVSGMVTSAIYPVMSRYFITSKDSLETFTVLSSKYLAIIGFPIGFGCLILANKFIALFYAGQYTQSILAFQILAVFIPIRLLSSITSTFLTSINKQGIRTITIFSGAIFNIILNLVLIPHISYIGASIATVLSELFLYLLYIHFINKYFKKLKLNNILLKPFLASLVMGVSIFFLRDLNLFLIIILAALIYFTCLILLKTFTEEDKYIFREIMKKKHINHIKP